MERNRRNDFEAFVGDGSDYEFDGYIFDRIPEFLPGLNNNIFQEIGKLVYFQIFAAQKFLTYLHSVCFILSYKSCLLSVSNLITVC